MLTTSYLSDNYWFSKWHKPALMHIVECMLTIKSNAMEYRVELELKGQKKEVGLREASYMEHCSWIITVDEKHHLVSKVKSEWLQSSDEAFAWNDLQTIVKAIEKVAVARIM